MADDSAVGGTKIQRRPQQQQQAPHQMQQQVPQQMHQEQQQYYPEQQQAPPREPPMGRIKSTFGNVGNITFDVKDFKYSLLVMLIFIILNSKMIWKQIQKFPMMGAIDPSMIALLVNSIIAGVVFYIMSNYIIKK
jgi:hypothetical protein